MKSDTEGGKMYGDRQFWHYTKETEYDGYPLERRVMLTLCSYENLVLPGVEGVRDVHVVFEEVSEETRNFQWFAADDLADAVSAFKERMAAEPGRKTRDHPIEHITEKWGECEVVAEFRRAGKTVVVSKAAGLFFVDNDGRRTQVRLDDRAIVRYLANAMEDGS